MPSDILTLGFDTSAAHCAAALLSGGDCIAARHEEMAKGQGERLMVLLEEVLGEAGVGWRNLNRIGVGIGPGNFTGVRISVSAARGLALALEIPAAGVSVLEAMAFGTEGPVLATLDARRGQIYAQSFGTGTDFGPLLCVPSDISIDVPKLTCLGHEADAFAERLHGHAAPTIYAPGSAIARIAAKSPEWANKRPAPLYLRGADAAPPSEAPPVILP